MPKAEILDKVRSFRDGAKPATVMQQIAKGYSDQQVELIADYFSRRPR
jgi:cytochrome c553